MASLFTGQLTLAMYAEDVGRDAEWYRDMLDFVVLADHRDQRPVPYVLISPSSNAGWQLILTDPSVHGPELAERFKAEIGFSPHIMLATADLAETVRRLRDRGVEFTDEPHREGPFYWAHFKDLHGNVITLMDANTTFDRIG